MPDDQYTHGHHESVVQAHATRSIANSAAYLEPHLAAGLDLLDVGCGPGSITAEFASRLAPNGSVLGVDLSDEVIARAQASYPESGASFRAMDLYSLDVAENSYDIAHAHQVLQHVSDPVGALREMRRVVKPGGIVAVRDADYAGMHWAPESPMLTNWLDTYRQVAYANDAEPDAGRHLLSWAQQAGFSSVTPSVATWLFADPTGRKWWGSTWAERIVQSSLAEQAVEGGFASVADLQAISAGWREWTDEPAGWFVVPHAQIICHV